MPQGDYIVAPKRDHCIAQYGRFIISFGGVNDLGRVIDDVDIYDTEFGFWEPLKITNPIEGVCYSTCASCFYPDRFEDNKSKLEVDSIPSPNWGKVEHLIKEEGIYLFGGRNKKSEVNGTLYVLKLGNRFGKNYWTEPKTTGKGPCHRYQHCMVKLSSKNLLIIHGGRTSQNVKDYSDKLFDYIIKNDYNQRIESPVQKSLCQDSFTLSDMWALKLDTLEWIRIILNDEEKLQRTNHCMAKISDDSLLLFGGNGSNSMYCNLNYLIVLNPKKISRKKSLEVEVS